MSHAEFKAAMGDVKSATRLEELAPRSGELFKIPDWTILRPGDVILSSSIDSYRRTPVYLGQRAQGYAEEHAKWGHAMLYVDRLHIAESQTFFRSTGTLWPASGTRLWPLTAYVGGNELLVCRLKGTEGNLGKKIADHATYDLAAQNRGYDFRRILVESWVYQLAAKVAPAFLWKKATAETVQAAVICSEFVLECMAIGAGLMVAEYDKVLSKELFFSPATVASSDRFTTFPMEYREVSPPRLSFPRP